MNPSYFFEVAKETLNLFGKSKPEFLEDFNANKKEENEKPRMILI